MQFKRIPHDWTRLLLFLLAYSFNSIGQGGGCSQESQDSGFDVRKIAADLKHEDVVVRRDTAQGLGVWAAFTHNILSKELVPVLTMALEDKDSEVRKWSVWALSKVDPKVTTATPLVTRLLVSDKEVEVRRQSALFFAERPPDAKQAIEAIKKSLKDEDGLVRIRSAWAVLLANPTNNEAMSILADGLKDSSEVTSEVAYAFGKLELTGVPALRKALKDKSSTVRLNAIYGMQKVALELYGAKERWPRDAIQDLIDLLQHEDKNTVYSAIYVLSLIGEPAKDAVPGIIQCLRHKEWSVRYRAAIDVRSFGALARGAIPLLKEALKDPEERVRIEAKLTLKSWSH